MDQGSGNQSYNTPAPAETNGVARISLIQGDVSTQRGDNGAWSAAVLNAPVVAGDRVSTGDGARTELQLDYANVLRLAENSQANITQLTRSQIQIQLGRGMANYTVFKNSDADAEIDTPNVAIRTDRRESSFRILVTVDDHTEVLVRNGEVDVTTPQGGTRVEAGQFITVIGTGDQEQYKIGEAPARGDFDQWNTDRDNMIRNSVARRHTNEYYVGAEDLDAYGSWEDVPDYGPVWRPTEGADWAPYRDGRWVYEPFWGWTWVSYDPWGWAPYHYGRWMMYDGAWAWWPGPVYGNPYYQPIWAPAYVSFFGYGSGVGFGFGFGGGWGSIGWLPLGPCDRFHPWYGRYGARFGVTDINVYNRGGFAALHRGNRFSNMNLALHDPHFRGGTTVSANEFGRGRMSARPMSHEAFRNANFTTGRVPVRPGRESFSASGRRAAPSTMRHVSRNQHFFSARGNTAIASRSFGRGQQRISNTERLGGRSTGREVARPGSGREVARSANARSMVNSNNGFRRFSSEAGPNHVAGSRSVGPGNNSRPRSETRGNSNSGAAGRPGNFGGSRATRENRSNGGGWQKFSPMHARPSYESGRGNAPVGRAMGRTEDRGSYGSARNAGPQGRGYNPEARSYRGYSRPPLNMRQPIVMPRSYGRGSYGGNRGGYSGGNVRRTPSYGGGGRPTSSYGGARSAPSYGGGHSASRGGFSHGGGFSRGGGSSHGGSSHGGGSHGGGGGRHGR
jgi:Family of unknown function (DUF6600)/FecR protein